MPNPEIKGQRSAKGLHYDVELRLMNLLNILLVVASFTGCWVFYYVDRVIMRPSPRRSAGVIFLFMVLYSIFGRVYDAFLISLKRISDLFFSQVLSILMADTFMFAALWLMSGSFPNILPALAALAGQVLFSFLWCKGTHDWYFKRYAGQKTYVVYEHDRNITDLLGRYGLDKRFSVRGSCTAEECLRTGMRDLNDLDAVFLCGVHSHERNQILKYCVAHGFDTYVIPRIGDVIMNGAKRMHMFHQPVLCVKRYSPAPEYLLCKRAFDIVFSAIVILITSPLMLGVAIAVKAQDGGPVFYRQKRLTKNGRTFDILKFRSMRTDAEKDGVARLSTGENDDRITPVGRVIRACRLDELPQLFNILGGSMSVVGPRPERPEIARQYESEIPEFSLRLQAKAGLTGYAQVYGKYNSTPYDKLQMDLMYIANLSIVEDLKIIFATIRILFMSESTEGVEAGQTTAMGEEKTTKPAPDDGDKHDENIA